MTNIWRYVDNLVAPMDKALVELEKAKEQMIEKLKKRLVGEMEMNEKLRSSQEMMEEKLKTEVAKNAENETIIQKLREENAKLLRGEQQEQQSQSCESTSITKSGTKRKRDGNDETAPLQEPCFMLGFGLNDDGTRQTRQKMAKPVKMVHLGKVEFVDAFEEICKCQTSFGFKREDYFFCGVNDTPSTGANLVTSDTGNHYAIDAAGELWGWGAKDWSNTRKPKLIRTVKGIEIKEVSTHYECVACITVDDTCYVWGDCDKLCLTYEGDHVQNPPELLTNMFWSALSVSSIAIGVEHALMITHDEVHAIGHNYDGQLGIDEDFTSEWTKVSNLAGIPIKVQCGYRCSAVLTTSSLYTLGNDIAGAMPKRIELESVADIALRMEEIIAVTTSGEVYTWGTSGYGEDGEKIKPSNDQNVKPIRVRGFEGYHIHQVSAGYTHMKHTAAHNYLLRCSPKSK